MAAIQFANHFTDHIIQIQTSLHVRKKNGIFFFDRFPVHAMHVLHIETITVSTPCLIEYLCPFFRIIHRNLHIGKIDSITQINTAGRYVGHIDLSSFIEKSLFTSRCNRHGGSVSNSFFLLLFQIVHFCSAATIIPDFFTIRIKTAIVRAR